MAGILRLNGLVTAFAAAALAAGLDAQVAPESRPAAPDPGAKPRMHHAISPEVASQLSALTPKFTPGPPKPPPAPAEEQVDLRDVDKPKNDIIRLPKYLVQEPRPVVLSERAVNTEQGLADLAIRRYVSEADRALNRFTLPLFGTSLQKRALLMYAEDERLRNMSDLNEDANAAAKSDPAAGAYIRREAQKTYLRTDDFGWNGGAK